MMKKLLITGGLGYVGGRLARALMDAGYEVFLGTRRVDLRSPAWLPHAQVVQMDWASFDQLQRVCAGMDCIIHLAAMSEKEAMQDPVAALLVNGVASVRLLEAAIAAKAQRFVYFSTTHVYGAPLAGDITERTLPRPQHPYAISHRVTEDYVLAAHDKKRIEGVVIRLSNGFGVPASPDVDQWMLLVNDLCRQAAEVGVLQMRSAGLQPRNFITLTDVGRAVSHLLKMENAQLGDGLFNLGEDFSMSVIEMVQRIAMRWKIITGKALPIIRPEPSITEMHPTPLNYSSEKFKSTGFSLLSDHDGEIDATLKLCQRIFGQKAAL